jgi:hypothetical protein
MENIFGGLIEFKSKKEFDLFIDNVGPQSALQIIEASITYGLQNGLYSLEESHTLYKCLTKLKEKCMTQQ